MPYRIFAGLFLLFFGLGIAGVVAIPDLYLGIAAVVGGLAFLADF